MSCIEFNRRAFIRNALLRSALIASSGARSAFATHAPTVAEILFEGRSPHRVSSKYHSKCAWVRFLRSCNGFEGVDLIRRINCNVNRIPYRSEREDIWKTPREFANTGGDCEDFAIAKFVALTEFGFNQPTTGILVLKQTTDRPAHTLAVCAIGGKAFFLDNKKEEIYNLPPKGKDSILFLINRENIYF